MRRLVAAVRRRVPRQGLSLTGPADRPSRPATPPILPRHRSPPPRRAAPPAPQPPAPRPTCPGPTRGRPDPALRRAARTESAFGAATREFESWSPAGRAVPHSAVGGTRQDLRGRPTGRSGGRTPSRPPGRPGGTPERRRSGRNWSSRLPSTASRAAPLPRRACRACPAACPGGALPAGPECRRGRHGDLRKGVGQHRWPVRPSARPGPPTRPAKYRGERRTAPRRGFTHRGRIGHSRSGHRAPP